MSRWPIARWPIARTWAPSANVRPNSASRRFRERGRGRYDSCLQPGHGWLRRQTSRKTPMLITLAIVLIILWALGFVAFHVGGGLIHILLVIALIVIVYRL